MGEPPLPVRLKSMLSGIKKPLRICGVVLLIAIGLALLAAAIVWAPQRLVDEGKTRANSGKPALSANEQVTAENSVRTTLVQAFGGLILVVGATFTLRQLQISREQLRVSSAQQALATELGRATLETSRRARTDETWTKAVDQLGASSLATRLGGIASLERISATDIDTRSVVMEVLSAYIRDTASRNDPAAASEPERVGWWGEPAYRPQADVQLALRVLGRLHKEAPSLEQLLEITDRKLLDFKEADLRGANLTLGHYEGSQFHRADLSEANLSGGHFEAAVFFQAVAPRANFAGDFLGASFAECDLTSVDFHSGQLQDASFENAELDGASFNKADVRGADFSFAIFDDKTSFVGIVFDDDTKWPEGFDVAARVTREDES